MKALPIKATLTVEGMINDLGNEVKKEKISTGLFKRSLIFYIQRGEGGYKDVSVIPSNISIMCRLIVLFRCQRLKVVPQS